MHVCGFNNVRQLGAVSDLSSTIISEFKRIDVDVNGLKTFSMGDSHSVIVMKNGDILASGDDREK